MRWILTLALCAALWVSAGGPAGAQIVDHTGGQVLSGTPVAIAVRGPEGAIAGWQRSGGGSGPRWTCTYHPIGVESGADHLFPAPITPVAGRTFLLICHDESRAVIHQRYVRYDPADPLSGLAAGERAAELARQELRLPDPPLVFSPPGDQVVGLPTWLAVDLPWEPVSASASVSNVTATVVATPSSVTWRLGDGSTATCPGPGSRFDPARPLAGQASYCTHIYTWPSSGQPGGVYAVEARVSYDVSWSATDGSGASLDAVTRTSTHQLRVVEVQALIR